MISIIKNCRICILRNPIVCDFYKCFPSYLKLFDKTGNYRSIATTKSINLKKIQNTHIIHDQEPETETNEDSNILEEDVFLIDENGKYFLNLNVFWSSNN